jgi:hypothetical protein
MFGQPLLGRHLRACGPASVEDDERQRPANLEPERPLAVERRNGLCVQAARRFSIATQSWLTAVATGERGA